MNTQVFTKGKKTEYNEDAFGHNDTTFVVCDGSTGKTTNIYGGKTGGEIAANLLVDTCLKTDRYGVDLVNHLTDVLATKQRELERLSNGEAIDAASTLLCAKIHDNKLIITQVADTAFRINGKGLHQNPIVLDELVSSLRAHYIRLTGDVPGGRTYIEPLLIDEANHSNNVDSPLGYGVIDGSKVPEKFIIQYEYDLSTVKTLEIFTDGYYAVPAEATIEAYEVLSAQIEAEDPDKYLAYPSTKSKDDRTVMIVSFE